MFIQGFGKVYKPLKDLTRKGKAFVWSAVFEDDFELLKRLFTQCPILAYFDADRPTRVETCASYFSLGALLLQLCHDGK
jgi:hypothetical protein